MILAYALFAGKNFLEAGRPILVPLNVMPPSGKPILQGQERKNDKKESRDNAIHKVRIVCTLLPCSTAYDQAFTYGRNIFDEISNVVDDIFTTYITKPNIRQPLFTQYCDGKKSKCPNWMTQWGSKDLGDKGYSAIDILKNFYGYDIFLMQAKSVQGVPLSFPGEALQMGSSGAGVRTIQEQLNRVSNNYPAIPKVKVDGIYGPGTVEAVKKFQSIFKMPTSGIVDFATWYKISDIFVAVSRLAELK